jgi:hypothetical protein
MAIFNLPQNLNYYFSLSCVAFFALHSFPSYAETPAQTEASIQTPGPDLANFPNSAFTLPQGRAYLESSSFNYSSRTRNDDPAQYSTGYLLRYGLFDNFEVRLMSDGYTWVDDENKTNGMSPQILDVKWHVMDEQKESYLPAMGIEVSVQTDWAARALRSNWLPALSLNFDQTLPFDIAFEYNVGFTSQENNSGKTDYQLALSWALQREVFADVAAFVNGYTNTANGLTTTAVGGGLQWIPARRVAFFTNLSAGLTKTTPKFSTLVGFAVAF